MEGPWKEGPLGREFRVPREELIPSVPGFGSKDGPHAEVVLLTPQDVAEETREIASVDEPIGLEPLRGIKQGRRGVGGPVEPLADGRGLRARARARGLEYEELRLVAELDQEVAERETEEEDLYGGDGEAPPFPRWTAQNSISRVAPSWVAQPFRLQASTQ